MEPIPEGDNPRVDHLIFVVHGIGPVCDLRFRGIVECGKPGKQCIVGQHRMQYISVDDMRLTSSQILSSHFKSSQAEGKLGRVEFLPIYWHDAVRSDAVGKCPSNPHSQPVRPHDVAEEIKDCLLHNSSF